MNNLHLKFFLFAGLWMGMMSCNKKDATNLDMNNYFAWCIVPFDSLNRSPEERIEMLNELGIKSYAYDWRTNHIPEMAREWELAAENGIYILAVWMWIDVADSVNNLSSDNERVFQILEDTGIETQLWIGMSEAGFEGLDDSTSMQRSSEMLRYLSQRAAETGCKIGLYNHGGWFGDPVNQVRLIESLPDLDLGIIFNFHHAHELIDNYEQLVDIMLPYLWAVNLNGMRAEGPKILPIGLGNLEKEMIGLLQEKGFNGPWGILGHVEEEDVKVVLQRNLKGLERVM